VPELNENGGRLSFVLAKGPIFGMCVGSSLLYIYIYVCNRACAREQFAYLAQEARLAIFTRNKRATPSACLQWLSVYTSLSCMVHARTTVAASCALDSNQAAFPCAQAHTCTQLRNSLKHTKTHRYVCAHLQIVSRDIRRILTDRAFYFGILLDDVSITHLTFSKLYEASIEAKQVAQQEAERAKFVVDKALQEKQSAIVRAQVREGWTLQRHFVLSLLKHRR